MLERRPMSALLQAIVQSNVLCWISNSLMRQVGDAGKSTGSDFQEVAGIELRTILFSDVRQMPLSYRKTFRIPVLV